mmetsp:Transcript_6406/g.19423  ORF Transcript_6406/g.19423 Transcript_6406/m.19423 type:complete len:256 (-) Transcript_6406:2327-3094(-)
MSSGVATRSTRHTSARWKRRNAPTPVSLPRTRVKNLTSRLTGRASLISIRAKSPTLSTLASVVLATWRSRITTSSCPVAPPIRDVSSSCTVPVQPTQSSRCPQPSSRPSNHSGTKASRLRISPRPTRPRSCPSRCSAKPAVTTTMTTTKMMTTRRKITPRMILTKSIQMVPRFPTCDPRPKRRKKTVTRIPRDAAGSRCSARCPLMLKERGNSGNGSWSVTSKTSMSRRILTLSAASLLTCCPSEITSSSGLGIS